MSLLNVSRVLVFHRGVAIFVQCSGQDNRLSIKKASGDSRVEPNGWRFTLLQKGRAKFDRETTYARRQ